AVYPIAVLRTVGPDHSAQEYGRVFTAWGLAGLLGPWLAGLLFEHNGTYTVAIMVAAGSSALSLIVALALRSRVKALTRIEG
ncbi:MAG: YbfB/YjiJ family MFS transporter, partial [Pseudomonadota bacterium]